MISTTIRCTAPLLFGALATPLMAQEAPAAARQTEPAAYVRQAADAWDAAEPAPQEARRLLGLALEAYRALAQAAPQDAELADYIVHLEKVQQLMERFAGFDAAASLPQDEALQGFRPSYLGLELIAIPDTDAEGLRRRLTCILAYMERNRARQLVSALGSPDLRYIDLRTTTAPSKDYLGLTSWFADATSFGAKMEFYMENMPPDGSAEAEPAAKLSQELHRAVIVNDTLAHELTHVYFCSRYPKIARGNEDVLRRANEGHAINVAYTFVRDVYFRGTLSPEQYLAFMLSPRYRGYFHWYRSEILTPTGAVRWDKLDALDLQQAETPSYYVRTRAPHTSGTPKAAPYRYFGR